MHLPLRAIRFVTDPVVDLALYLIARTVVPPLIRFGESMANVVFSALTASLGEGTAVKVFDLSIEMVCPEPLSVISTASLISFCQSTRGIQAANATWEFVAPHLLPSPEAAIATTDVGPSFIERLASQDSVFLRLAEPYFAPIGHTVRTHTADCKETWIRLAVGSGTSSRLFAIFLGYAVNAVILALYLNVLTVGSVKSAGRAVRNAVRQQLLVVKVSYAS